MTLDCAGADGNLDRLIDAVMTPDRLRRLGVAVSGGGDSMALLHVLQGWARRHGRHLVAVTVDHGLRPAAKAEAAMVQEVCEGLGVGHTTLSWEGWDGVGNLQDKARRARYALISDWALGLDLDAVALAHTADDQAETFLMRLARGAGVDGLAAMAPRRRAGGVEWLRPFLGVERTTLRSYLRSRRLGWVEDPSNADPRFLRVQVRQILQMLAPLGLDAAAILATTQRLGMAREALDVAALEAARRIASVEAGDVCFERAGLLALTPELQRRLVSHALAWVSTADYRPRHEALAAALAAIAERRDMTLHGCRVIRGKDAVRITREFQAVKSLRVELGSLWDRRWRIVAPQGVDMAGLEIAALGEVGLATCSRWRETGLGRATLLASPSVWRGADLVAAPLAGNPASWRAELVRGEADYFLSILSH